MDLHPWVPRRFHSAKKTKKQSCKRRPHIPDFQRGDCPWNGYIVLLVLVSQPSHEMGHEPTGAIVRMTHRPAVVLHVEETRRHSIGRGKRGVVDECGACVLAKHSFHNVHEMGCELSEFVCSLSEEVVQVDFQLVHETSLGR